MGRIAKVLAFIRDVVSEIKADPGDGANVDATHFGAAGDDSPPRDGDFAILVKVPGRGQSVSVGYVDPNNEGEASSGERRLYSRDSGGDVAAVLWIKSDGTIEVGKDASDFVALASETDNYLNAIRDALDAFVDAAPVSQDGGAALQTAVSTVWPGSTSDADVGSETVKVEP